MAGDINIPINGDASRFIRETEDAEQALEKVSDALDDMARDSKKSADKAEKAVDDLADSFDDARKAAKKLGDEGDDSGRKLKKGMDDAGEGVKEFGDEANSTAKESAASFDGSAESIVDAFQEIAANAFQGFGPAGAIAGLAAAAGIGLAMAGFENVQEAQKKSEERAAEWADAYIEAGSRALTFDQGAAKVRDIITDPEMYKTAQTNADLWGVSIDVAVAALAGSPSAIEEVTKALDKKKTASEKDAKAAQEMAEANGSALLALTPAEVEYNKAQEALNLLTGEMERGAQGADVMSRYLIDSARATEGATESVDEFGDSIITLPDGKQVYIDAQTGQATANVDAITNKIYGVPDGSASINLDTSGASTGLRNFISQNEGKTIKLYTKIITQVGGQIP